MLDILISLCLVFALFSGLVSGISELIAQILEMRGKVLYQAVALLLGDVTVDTKRPDWKSFLDRLLSKMGFSCYVKKDLNSNTSKLFDHPLIDTLSQPGAKASYVPASNFSAALVQVLSKDGSWHELGQTLNDRNTPLGQLFGPMFDQANGDIEKFKAQVETHFNAVMDRVSGWYKRRSQFMMFFIGLLLAAVLNVDTIYIARHFLDNPKLVAELVEIGKKIQTNQPSKIETTSVKSDSQSANQPSQPSQDISNDVADLKKKISDFENLNLPIGWDIITDWKIKIISPIAWIGWFITALAATLGAPFWFDVMAKLFIIRGTGKKPEESSPASTTTPATPPVQVIVTPTASTASNAEDMPLNKYEAGNLNGEDIAALRKALGLPEIQSYGKIGSELRTALKEWQRTTGCIINGQFDESSVLAILYPQA